MPRYRKSDRAENSRKMSVFSLFFPFVALIYAEAVLACFTGSGVTVYKVLPALAAGCICMAFQNITFSKALNFILQTLWLCLCLGLITAQFLCYRLTGEYFSPFSGELPQVSSLLSQAADEPLFVVCMALPLVLQLTVQLVGVIFRRDVLSTLLGAKILAFTGMLLLSVIISFAAVTFAMQDDSGEDSPRRMLEYDYMPTRTVETFGALPQAVIDFKYNVLHIRSEDVVHRYVLTESGEKVELSGEEAEQWLEEG